MNIDADELFSFAWASIKLVGSPTLRVFIGEANEKCEAIANDGIAGDIPDDIDEDTAGTMDGVEVLFVGIKEPTLVDVEDRGDINILPSWEAVIKLVAPGTFGWAATPPCGVGQTGLSLMLFVLEEFGVISPERVAEAGLIPGIPTGNVESIALIDSDDLLAPVGGAVGGKFVSGVNGAWNNAIKQRIEVFIWFHLATFYIG